LWSPSQLTPQSPREMRGWLQARSDILRLLERPRANRRALTRSSAKLGETTDRLEANWRKGSASRASGPADLLKAAAAAVSAMETTFQNARLIAQQREGCERRQRDLEAALGKLDRQEAEWRSQWSEAAGAIGLREEALDEEADAALGTWQAVPALEASMKDLEHRIGRIEQDWRPSKLPPNCAPPSPPTSAKRRSRGSERRPAATAGRGAPGRDQPGGVARALAELEDKAEACRRHAQLNDSELAGLCTAAGAADRDELGALAGRIEQGAKPCRAAREGAQGAARCRRRASARLSCAPNLPGAIPTA
jgi:hypothetical protein